MYEGFLLDIYLVMVAFHAPGGARFIRSILCQNDAHIFICKNAMMQYAPFVSKNDKEDVLLF